MKVAAVQLQSGPDRLQNLEKIGEFFREAVGKGAKLVCFPENFTLFAPSHQVLSDAESLEGTTVAKLKALAAHHRAWMLAGSLALRPRASASQKRSKLTNTCLLINPSGKIAELYTKMHLFDVSVKNDTQYSESRHFDPGKKPALHRVGALNLGLSICYDIRFPELYRSLVSKGVQAFAVPSAFTSQTGAAHWDLLTRTRAVENLCYLIAPAQTGSPYPGRETYGHTRIVAPWGEVVSEIKKEEGIIFADLDLGAQKELRRKFPCLKSRSPFFK